MLTEETYPYEILIRIHPDGSIAAHAQRRRVVMLDGVLLQEQILEPTPLDTAAFPLSDVMSEATATALAAATRLTQQLQASSATITALREDNSRLAGVVTALTAAIQAQG